MQVHLKFKISAVYELAFCNCSLIAAQSMATVSRRPTITVVSSWVRSEFPSNTELMSTSLFALFWEFSEIKSETVFDVFFMAVFNKIMIINTRRTRKNPSPRWDLNPRPSMIYSDALPIELLETLWCAMINFGSRMELYRGRVVGSYPIWGSDFFPSSPCTYYHVIIISSLILIRS